LNEVAELRKLTAKWMPTLENPSNVDDHSICAYPTPRIGVHFGKIDLDGQGSGSLWQVEMFNPASKYQLHWELTDICNLKCPMCPRTDFKNRCRPAKAVRFTQVSLSDVRKWFPSEFLKRLARIDFCGNFGDPCMASDFYEICELLITRYGIRLMVSTNGSMRKPQWWEKLGRLFAGTPGKLEFHVDGLRDTNHLYRIGAEWDAIEANASAFISAGGRAEWHFILFQHNQHQLAEAQALARRLGFAAFLPTVTGRFSKSGRFSFQHPDGDWRTLEKASLYVKDNSGIKSVDNPGFSHLSETEARSRIACKAMRNNRFFLDVAGNLAPCCWISGSDPRRPGDMLRAISAAGQDPEAFNIRSRPIESILQNELFSQTFPHLWSKRALTTCRKKCQQHHRNRKIRISL
jgi:MoaA/NifB/PqqE/SkfB family radical SAM enzyme